MGRGREKEIEFGNNLSKPTYYHFLAQETATQRTPIMQFEMPDGGRLKLKKKKKKRGGGEVKS